MKLLALDSSGLVASVALFEDDCIKAEYTINHKKTHSETLLPMIAEITAITEIRPKEIDAIAIAKGPGSFTGLRIGSATAKGLGLALNKPIISVSTLEAMAVNLMCTDGLICPLMDARRSQVYTAVYRFDGKGSVKPEEVLSPCAIPVSELLEKLEEFGEKVTFLGDGVPVYAELLEQLTLPHGYAPAHMNRQRAASVALLAAEYGKEGKLETAAEHKPEYLRVSQAERERAERQKAQ